MGFRKHRRRGGGGGGFGGQHQRHHHHGYGTGEPNGLQPGDDVGNRRSFKPVQIPPEDLGNRKDPDEAEWIPDEDCGNRIDAAPTHALSGVLLDLDGRRRRRRPKGVSAPERVGRYFVGGVNPLIASNVPRAFPGKTLEESMNGSSDVRVADTGGGGPGDDGSGDGLDEGGGGRRRRRRGRGRDHVDGVAAQEVSERRAQRFFDFEEDDRFDYTLKTTAEQKRKDAEDAVRNVVVEAGRDATVAARLIEDGDKPKVLVTIDERGPAPSLPPQRRSENAQEPLFVMGNAALMSLNYLANKIVNRFPDDRIRLAILPAADQKLYLDALEEHRRTRRPKNGATAAPLPAAPAGRPTENAREAAALDADNAPAPVVTDEPAEEPPLNASEREESLFAAVDVEPAVHEADDDAQSDDAQGDDAQGDDAAAVEAAAAEAAAAEAAADEADEAGEASAAPKRAAKKKAAAKAPAKAPAKALAKAPAKAAPKKARASEVEDKPKRPPAKRAPKKVEVARARPKA